MKFKNENLKIVVICRLLYRNLPYPGRAVWISAAISFNFCEISQFLSDFRSETWQNYSKNYKKLTVAPKSPENHLKMQEIGNKHNFDRETCNFIVFLGINKLQGIKISQK